MRSGGARTAQRGALLALVLLASHLLAAPALADDWRPPPGAMPGTATAVYLEGEAGSRLQGGPYAYTPDNALIRVSQEESAVAVLVWGDERWSGFFAVPGRGPLVPGRYEGAEGMAGDGSAPYVGWGCTTLEEGWLEVDHVRYEDGELIELELRFGYRCQYRSGTDHGAVRWDAAHAWAPPANPTAEPSGTWRPTADQMPAGPVAVYLEREDGTTWSFTHDTARVAVVSTEDHIGVRIQELELWSIDFRQPYGMTAPWTGHYADLRAYPMDWNPKYGGLGVTAKQAGCASGWFAVDDLALDADGEPVRLEARFACDAQMRALRGAVRWDASTPPGASNPQSEPADAWRPDPATLPDAPRYVHLESSDPDESIVRGETHTYTDADAHFITSLHLDGQFMVSVWQEDVPVWVGRFTPPDAPGRLQEGHYADLYKDPWHNPAYGGLSWGGEGRGCTSSGWFTVDEITWTDEALVAVELRFEHVCQHGGGPGPPLHGAIRWEGHQPIPEPDPEPKSALTDVHASAHADAIRAVAEAGIATGHPDGTFRPADPVSRGQMATFLARALDLTATGPTDFADTENDPHEHAIAAVAEAGIATGHPDGTFRPADPVSRGQMATFLARALDLTASEPPRFTDTAGSPHEDAIAAVAEAGIATGHPDGTFRPADPVTRGQMATFLARALGLL